MNKMSGSICILGLGLHSVLPCLEDLPDVAKLSVSGKVLEGSEDRLAIDVLPYKPHHLVGRHLFPQPVRSNGEELVAGCEPAIHHIQPGSQLRWSPRRLGGGQGMTKVCLLCVCSPSLNLDAH